MPPKSAPVPKHNNPCEGLPNKQPCPQRLVGDKDGVVYNHNFLDLCGDCSQVHDDVRDGKITIESLNQMLSNNGAPDSRSTRASNRGGTAAEVGTEPCIFDPVLCYVASARETSTRKDIVQMVAAYFAGDLVSEAKTVLWKCASGGELGDMTKRKNTDERTGKEANVMDIYDGMRKLEEVRKLPTFGVKAAQLHLLPKVQPSELLEYSVTERVSQLEDKFERYMKTVDLLSDQNAALRNEVADLRRQPPGPPPPTNAGPAAQPPGRGHDQSSKKTMYSGAVKSNIQQNTSQLPNLTNTNNSHVTEGASSSSGGGDAGDPNGFRLPTDQLKRGRRRQKVVTGKGANFHTLQGSEPDRSIYVYRLLLTTTEDDLRKFLTESNIVIRGKMEELAKPEWTTKSYKVTLPASQQATALGLEWPENVCVRPWHYYPKKA